MNYNKLIEVAELFDSLHQTPKYSNSGYPMIRVADISSGNLQFENCLYVSLSDFQKYTAKHLPVFGDIVISRVGVSYGVFAYVNTDRKFCLGQNTAILSPKINSRYLYYCLNSPIIKRQIDALVVGSTQETLSLKNIKSLMIPRYGELIENRIAEILSVLDSKIEINKKINENLFQQAQALYKNRFVNMRPFNGVMPATWRQGSVSEIIELHDSKRIPLSSRERANLEKIYPYYGAASVMDYVDRYLFDGIYLLLGEDGTVVDSKGFPILQYVEGKFWVNNHAHIITGKNGFSVELLYLLLSLTNVQSIVTGAVQPKISQGNLNNVSVIIPSLDELLAFDATIQPIFAQIRNLRSENNRLADIRDTLLPGLMSGELDVS